MKYRYSILLFLAAFILQTTACNSFRVFGIGPNLILALVCALQFMFNDWSPIILGTFFGILQDLCFAEVIGPTSMAYLAVSMAIAIFRRYLYNTGFLPLCISGAAGAILYELVRWCGFTLFGGAYGFIEELKIIPISMVWTVLGAAAIYAIPPIRRLSAAKQNLSFT